MIARSTVFAMLLSAAAGALGARALPSADTRVFEIRTYHTLPGRLDALNARFRNHTMRLFEKHGMQNVGYWIPTDSTRSQNTLVYVISHASRAQAAANWKAFVSDPQWQKVAQESEADGKIIEKIDSDFMTATDYSPIK